MVDAKRNLMNQCMLQMADGDEFDMDMCDGHSNKPMMFTGRVKAMIDECVKRGLPLNTDR